MMKRKICRSLLWLLASFALINCTGNNTAKQTSAQEVKSPQFSTPIDGSWQLVAKTVEGKEIEKSKLSQFKMFHDGFFSLISNDSSGTWAGAGTFVLEGNSYKELFSYCTVREYIGARDRQEYEVKGDTLIFRGFNKVIFSNGEDKTSSFPSFEEKRVRVKP